jgi:predicted RNase H-like HicB family nuclease
MEYVIVIHVAEEGGYWAEFPGLPGCYTQGETIEEILVDAPNAIQSHVEALHEFGQPIPNEHLVVATIHIPTPSAA